MSAIFEMTSSFDVRQRQRAVTEFLVLEGKLPINILQRLESYRGTAICYSAVKKWVSKTKGEKENQV